METGRCTSLIHARPVGEYSGLVGVWKRGLTDIILPGSGSCLGLDEVLCVEQPQQPLIAFLSARDPCLVERKVLLPDVEAEIPVSVTNWR
jgi:hypothetical protein